MTTRTSSKTVTFAHPFLPKGIDRMLPAGDYKVTTMAQKHSTSQLTPREYKDGRGWYVQATSDDGITENVGDFSSDSEAKDWIVRKSIVYFKARQK